jgi:2-keto-4-pentenoate hydratase/2-oxohepta-3-ene-1,7-dioic acid hydratase in catechol pathway
VKLATVAQGNSSQAIVIVNESEFVEVSKLFPGQVFPDVKQVIETKTIEDLKQALSNYSTPLAPLASMKFLAPYLHPGLIWGIGLNYLAHAADLAAVAPGDEPASFIKGDHTIIGEGEEIIIPTQSERTTAEAELGIVIGKYCRNVSEAEALDYLYGVVPILDQTAEDILLKNPRFLTRSKNFPTFFSFGPAITTMDEVNNLYPDFSKITVATVINGDIHRENTLSNMTFNPAYLISFHSKVMPLYPGDIISTGTPGAVHINHGDIVECNIAHIGKLVNPVTRQGS